MILKFNSSLYLFTATFKSISFKFSISIFLKCSFTAAKQKKTGLKLRLSSFDEIFFKKKRLENFNLLRDWMYKCYWNKYLLKSHPNEFLRSVYFKSRHMTILAEMIRLELLLPMVTWWLRFFHSQRSIESFRFYHGEFL